MRSLLLTLALAHCVATALALHMAVKNSKNGAYCIVADADISGSVVYFDTHAKKNVTYDFKVDNNTQTGPTISGKCFDKVIANQSTETLKLHFFPNGITPAAETPIAERWSIEVRFAKPQPIPTSTPTHDFEIIDYRLKAIFYPEHFNTSYENETVIYDKASSASLEWAASEGHGYTCTNTNLQLTNDSHIDFSGLKLLAFANLAEDKFRDNQLFEQCKADVRTSDLVPIIVGACLAGLVIIVLVAYLIGRARAKRQGYASV
jgi:hypothetical protein